jgi:urate oxidase
MALGAHHWGKSEIRVSKVLRGQTGDDFLDVTVGITLWGEVASAYTDADNSAVLPTDTMRNTVYGLAQQHLTHDLEQFGELLCDRFLARDDITDVEVSVRQRPWLRTSPTGFVGPGPERRTARVTRGEDNTTHAGVADLVLLKTGGSSFSGFPVDEFTILPEASDRLLATSLSAEWRYATVPPDTTSTWALVRATLMDHFFGDWSASMQHQGYLMGEEVLRSVPEVAEIELRLPNQHHLPFDLSRFGMEWDNTVFHPVSEPYGDIFLTVTR